MVARPERFELPTTAFEAQCSIQLSYGRAGAAVCQCGDFVANLQGLYFVANADSGPSSYCGRQVPRSPCSDPTARDHFVARLTSAL
jgi:hypothetical protein